MKIRFIDLKRQYEKYKKDIYAQIEEVLESSQFILGSKVQELEQKLADFVGTKHAVSCASGTDALLLALKALDVGDGDEIITSPFTFFATAEVIATLRAKPVFVDIRKDTYNIDPQAIERAVTSRTKGVIAVDIFGQCAEYELINKIAGKKRLFVIQDAAQSFGAKYKGRQAGSLADMGCTSFFPAKTFGCYGDGGMVFLDDHQQADKLRSLRNHGAGSDKYDNTQIGLNSRLDTLQAAVLLAKFPYFEEELAQRRKIANVYTERLKDAVTVPFVAKDADSVFSQYCIQAEDREGVIAKMAEAGIPTAIHYPRPLHLQTAFRYLGYQKGDLPVSEQLCARILALPMHPFLKKEEQDEIIQIILDQSSRK